MKAPYLNYTSWHLGHEPNSHSIERKCPPGVLHCPPRGQGALKVDENVPSEPP